MTCKNHPGVAAVDRCAGCAEAFCSNCLVEMNGQKYCGSCKVMAIKGPPPILESATVPCKEAGEALTMAIIGLFCFGIILGPMALSKASTAKKIIEADPRMTGSGKAQAAMIIGILDIVLWVVYIVSRVAHATH